MLFSRLASLRDAGTAVIVLTSDPEDALDLADRTYSLYRGTLTPFDPHASDAATLAAAITGATR